MALLGDSRLVFVLITASAVLIGGQLLPVAVRLLPVALLPVILAVSSVAKQEPLTAPVQQERRKRGAAEQKTAASQPNSGVDWSLCLPQWNLPALCVEEDDMPSFEEKVNSYFQVRHGIFCGEVGGEPIVGWPPGRFREALARLRPLAVQRTQARQSKPGLHEPVDDIMLAQRLIATDLNVSGAAQLVDDYLEYREEQQGGVTPTLEWIESGLAFVPCEDRLGRPVVVVRPRYHAPGNLAHFIRGLRCTLDAVSIHLLKKRRAGIGHNANLLEQYVMVFDFEGATWSNFDLEALKETIHAGTYHYPNKVGQTFVLHVSWGTTAAWNIAKKLLHPRTRRKCQFFASRDVREAMSSLVDSELLPPEYGGTAEPWPRAPAEACCFEEQVGELAARVYQESRVVPPGTKPCRSECPVASRTPSKQLPLRVERENSIAATFGCCGVRGL